MNRELENVECGLWADAPTDAGGGACVAGVRSALLLATMGDDDVQVGACSSTTTLCIARWLACLRALALALALVLERRACPIVSERCLRGEPRLHSVMHALHCIAGDDGQGEE